MANSSLKFEFKKIIKSLKFKTLIVCVQQLTIIISILTGIIGIIIELLNEINS
jgi:hypothetical protein